MVKSPNEKRKEHDRIFNTLAAQQKGIQAPMFSKDKQEKVEPVKVKPEKPVEIEPVSAPQPEPMQEQRQPEEPVVETQPSEPAPEQDPPRTPQDEFANAPEFDLEALFPDDRELQLQDPVASLEIDAPQIEEPSIEFEEPTQGLIGDVASALEPEQPEEIEEPFIAQEIQSIQEAEPTFDIVRERQFRQQQIREARLKMQGRVNQPQLPGLPVAPNDVFNFDMLDDAAIDDNPQGKPQDNVMPLFEEIEEQSTNFFEDIASVLEKLTDSLEKANIRLRQIEARIDRWGDI